MADNSERVAQALGDKLDLKEWKSPSECRLQEHFYFLQDQVKAGILEEREFQHWRNRVADVYVYGGLWCEWQSLYMLLALLGSIVVFLVLGVCFDLGKIRVDDVTPVFPFSKTLAVSIFFLMCACAYGAAVYLCGHLLSVLRYVLFAPLVYAVILAVGFFQLGLASAMFVRVWQTYSPLLVFTNIYGDNINLMRLHCLWWMYFCTALVFVAVFVVSMNHDNRLKRLIDRQGP